MKEGSNNMGGRPSIIASLKHGKLVRMYSVTVFFKLVVVALSFVNSILINRCLGVELRGQYTAITNWANLMQLFLNLGIGSAYPAIKRRYPENSKSIFSTLTIITAAIYAVVFFIVGTFVDIDARYVLAIAYTSTVQNLIFFIAIVEDVKRKNKVNILTTAIHTVVLILVLVLFKHNLYVVLYAVILDQVVLSVVLVAVNHIWEVKINAINKTLLSEVFKIAIPAMLMNVLMYLNYHADVLFLSEMTEDYYSVGLYGTAVTLANMLWIIPDAFKDILYNRAAKTDNPKEVIVAIVTNISICGVVLVGFTFIGRWFLGFVYGSDFQDAYPLVMSLFVGTFPMVLYKLIHPVYVANGKTKIVVSLLAVAVVVNIVGNLLLIPLYKAVGAAVASVISYMICGIMFYIKFTRDYHVGIVSTAKKCFVSIRRTDNNGCKEDERQKLQ